MPFRLNVGYLNESLLYYDFKMEHFALDDSGNVRLIDAGDVYSANETRSHKSTKECQSDEDCRSGSSIGWCDTKKKR